VSSIDTAFADELFEKLLYKDVGGEKIERRTTVNHAMKTARGAWNTVSRANPGLFPAKNPFEKMGLQSTSRETPHATFGEMMAFRAKAFEMGHPLLATGVLIGWELLQRKAHIFIRFIADHYRPDSRPDHVYVINYKTSTGSWEPLFDKKSKPLYPQLMAELDAIKALRPTGGLMLRRDGSGLPWSGKGEMLTQVAAHLKKDHPRCEPSAGADVHVVRTSWRCDRIEIVGADRVGADGEGSVVLDGSDGKLPARRRRG
jgi:hypothetical protein